MRRARGCCGRDRLRICVNFTNLEVFLSIPNCQRWAISHQTCEAWARWESSRFWTGDLCDLLDLTCDLSDQSLIYLSIQSEITPVDRLLRCINATIQDFHERETMRACVSSKFLQFGRKSGSSFSTSGSSLETVMQSEVNSNAELLFRLYVNIVIFSQPWYRYVQVMVHPSSPNHLVNRLKCPSSKRSPCATSTIRFRLQWLVFHLSARWFRTHGTLSGRITSSVAGHEEVLCTSII